ncbi:MAG: pyridoxal-phosphate dependent enzyme, partial [Gemmatimonadales bacterium]
MGYRTEANWSLSCSECEFRGAIRGLDTVCLQCSAPLMVSYDSRGISAERPNLDGRPWSMWRYREWLPLSDSELPVTLGEGCTPLLRANVLEERHGLRRVYVKDESQNPTGSFKARGLSVAVTRAVADGAER